MELDIREMMANAQRQSDEFMRQSREQARMQLEAQRQTIAQTSGMGGGMGAYPTAGTPAGRMLDTITQLVQRGVATGGGVASGAFGAGMGQVGALGGMAGGMAAAPIDLGGAMFTTQQRNMRFMQTFATAAGWGFARQRMDMTSTQAAEMAQEELASRMTRGWRRGLMGTLNVASFGISGYTRRLWGMEQAYEGREDIAAGLQQQMRYVRRSALERAGMEEFAGPFPTGITREGAREMARQMSQDVFAPLQQQYGLTGKELTVIQARAAGTMGRQGMEDLLGANRTVRSGLMGRQMRGVIEVQQALNLSAEEADQFWNMVGQMHGTAERIAQKTRQVRRTAGALGLGTREAMQGMMEFERLGIQTGMGADRARAVAENYTQSLYETYRRGGISGEQMMRYGGRTPEEGLRFQMQARFQENIGMWARGEGMMGVGVLAGNRQAWAQMTGGQTGFMGAMGAVGREYARDPFAGQRARFDPATHQTIGASADRAMYQLARQMPVVGAAGQHRVQRLAQFQAMTGLSDLDASSRYSQFEGEEAVAAAMLGPDVTKGKPGAASEVAAIYSEMTGTGMAASAAEMLGGGSVWEAAKKVWELRGTSGKSVASILQDQTRAAPLASATAQMIAYKAAGRADAGTSDEAAALERVAKEFVKQARAQGRELTSSDLNAALLNNASGMLLVSPNASSADQPRVGFDAAGNVILRGTNVAGLEAGIGERVSGLSASSSLLRGGVSARGGGGQRTALGERLRAIELGQDDTREAMARVLSAASGLGTSALEQGMYQGVSGLSGFLFGASDRGELPMTAFMKAAAGLETNAAAMAKAGAAGLSGLQTFANLYKATAGGVELQDMPEAAVQASLRAFGAARLAPLLGESIDKTEKMLEGTEGAKQLVTRLGETGMAQKLFASILDSIDKAKFNALGSSDATPLWVKMVPEPKNKQENTGGGPGVGTTGR